MRWFNSIVINLPATDICDSIKNFYNLSWRKNVVNKVAIIGNKKGGELGDKRILNDAFHETLFSINDTAMTFTYNIDDGPGPTSKENIEGYIGEVTVF